MSEDRTRYPKWEMGETNTDFEDHFNKHPEHKKFIHEFATDVTTNPFRHPKRKKIVKIQREIASYPDGCYRWSKSNLRVVYFPNTDDHTINPLDADIAPDIRYKKR
ncbi:MAG: hypothetical protein IMZ64_11695 [Bacteroidetes bacterium]|nr:hypothetical protein [Bacteroidota bacterium]